MYKSVSGWQPLPYIIFFRDREFNNLYFSCKLKLAVFFSFYASNFINILFFHKKVFENILFFFVIRYLLRIIPANIILIWFHWCEHHLLLCNILC